MRVISRYVLKRTLISIFMVFFVFASLLGVLGFADELARRGGDDFTSAAVMWFTLLELPSEIYRYFFAFIVMVGTLVSVGGLAASSELTAIRATGMPMWRLLVTILTPAVVATGVLFAMGELAGPAMKLEAETYRADKMGSDQSLDLAEWYQSGNRLVRVGQFLSVTEARNVFVIERAADNRIDRTLFATEADLSPEGWTLFGVEEVTWEGTDEQSASFTRSQLGTVALPALLTPELIYNLASPLDVLTLPEVWAQVEFLRERAVLSPVVGLEFWSRVSAPVLTLALSLIGIAFVFGSTRSISIGLRISLGVALALVLQIAQQFLGPVGLYIGLSPMWATFVPVLLALGVGMLLLRRNI